MISLFPVIENGKISGRKIPDTAWHVVVGARWTSLETIKCQARQRCDTHRFWRYAARNKCAFPEIRHVTNNPCKKNQCQRARLPKGPCYVIWPRLLYDSEMAMSCFARFSSTMRTFGSVFLKSVEVAPHTLSTPQQ